MTQTQIFGVEAQQYYDNNLPVIPLRYHDKKPVPYSWNVLAKRMPDEGTQQDWIRNNPQGNIGLVLGEASDLCAVDIDSEDEVIINAIKDALPPTSWIRIGQKGMIMLYKRNPKLKNRNIKDGDGEMVVELLCNARQMVLPPSIHPKTKKPYVENQPLIKALPTLVMLPDDIEDKIREALEPHITLSSSGSFRTMDYISRGGRDVEMTRYAGFLSRQVRSGQCTVIEAIADMEVWCEEKVEKVVGDDIDVNKGIHLFANFLINDVSKDNRVLPLDWDKDLTDEDKKSLGLNFDEVNEQWNYEQMISYLKAAFEKNSETSEERREAIEFIIQKIAKSPEPDEIMESRVIQYIRKHHKDGVTEAKYFKRIKTLRQGPTAGDNHADIAEAAIKRYEERNGLLRYWEGNFWIWTGDHWKVEDRDLIWAFIAQEFGFLDAAKKSNDHKGILQTMSKILPREISKSRQIGVNFINGFVDEDLKLHDHNPDQGMTYVLPYRYMADQAGNFPKFNQLLHGYWSENDDYEQKIALVQEAMCTTILGKATQFQQAFLLFGLPSSGKSQLMSIVEQLVPPVARCNIKPTMFKDKNAMAGIHEKLLNMAGELPEEGYIAGDLFKETITAETQITARKLYEDFFSFYPKAAHWFSSNHYPKSRDKTDGFFRRWIVLEFNRVIPNEEKVLDFGKQIVAEEIEAIVAWALESWVRLKKQGKYTEPYSHRKHIVNMQTNSSSVLHFLYNGKNLEYNGQCSLKDLYDGYHIHTLNEYGRTVSSKKFILELEMMTPSTRKFDIIEKDGEKWCVGAQIKK